MRGYASARVRIEFHDWKQVLRGASVKGGNEGWRRKKREKRRVVRFRPSFSSPLRFVIEGVSSRSENRGALLVSVDLKMYPFLSFSLSFKKLNGISSSNFIFDFYCHFFLRPGPVSRL